VKTRVLSLGEWLRWEVEVARVLGRTVRISLDGGGLEFPFAIGDTLGAILLGDLPHDDKLSALRMAAGALRDLHKKSTCRSAAEPWPLSHGDATCHNVIVNLPTGSVDWIDFEMRHDWSVPADERHADDLRALLFSSAACLFSSVHKPCVEHVLAGYGEPRIVHALRQWLDHQPRPTVFHLAQGAVTYVNYLRLRQLLSELILASISNHHLPAN
jgi:hypothetical protein